MRNRLGPMLESEIGNPAIITGARDFPPANSKSCPNAPGFLGVTELGVQLLLRTRRLLRLPHFRSPANLFLVDIPRRKWLLRRSRVSVESNAHRRFAGWGFD